MRILVTGGTGFIGSKLCERLLEGDYEVTNYDLKPSQLCETIIGDITDQEAFREAVKGCGQVFHLAAAADLNWCVAHPNEAVRMNIEGTRVVAEECAKGKVPLIFASTCCVYGDTPEHPSNEESICSPTDIYAVTKIAAEEVIKGYHRKHGLTYRNLRLGTTYGPGMRPTLAVYVFIKQALEEKELTIHGSGEQTRCMIYIDDLIDACVRILEMEHGHYINGTTINIATEEEISVMQIAQTILKLTGRPPDQYVHVPDRPGQIMKEQIDISKAKKTLSWEPKAGFRDGVKETLNWIRVKEAYE